MDENRYCITCLARNLEIPALCKILRFVVEVYILGEVAENSSQCSQYLIYRPISIVRNMHPLINNYSRSCS